MLKRIPVLRLLICLVLVCASAFVSPANASSAGIIITHIQAGTSHGATHEFVGLYNDSEQEIDITNWCLQNKSSVAFACFTTTAPHLRRYLPPKSSAVVVALPFVDYMFGASFSLIYEPTHATSGSIVGSSDTISLKDANGQVVDSVSWTTALPASMVLERRFSMVSPQTYQDTDSTSDWVANQFRSVPDDQTETRRISIDVCPNLDAAQEVIPEGFILDEDGQCIEAPLIDEEEPLPIVPTIMITELLPNPKGADGGKEFIEIYNPHNVAINLDDYKLFVGPNFEKSYSFPAGIVLQSMDYRSFTNSHIAFSLLNTSSRVRIVSQDRLIYETPSYSNPKEDIAWALIDGVWQYSNRPTPGEVNQSSIENVEQDEQVASLKPCAANQYRHPETNRCRLLASSGGTLTPCKDNQYRSEETNRCRNISSGSTEPAPCKEGQERNPETNRCRNIVAMSSADYGVLGVQSNASAGNWYIWATVGGVVLLAGAYAVWEWRQEIAKLLQRLEKFVRFKK